MFKIFNSAWTRFAISGKICKIILAQIFYLQEVLFSIRFYFQYVFFLIIQEAKEKKDNLLRSS